MPAWSTTRLARRHHRRLGCRLPCRSARRLTRRLTRRSRTWLCTRQRRGLHRGLARGHATGLASGHHRGLRTGLCRGNATRLTRRLPGGEECRHPTTSVQVDLRKSREVVVCRVGSDVGGGVCLTLHRYYHGTVSAVRVAELKRHLYGCIRSQHQSEARTRCVAVDLSQGCQGNCLGACVSRGSE